ncbi:hypothetical protein HO875_08130 [Streptococcus suis]|nr:hypothetical protein [Streptococcus suis]HEL1557172.1 hypothetical protein [Streptococcus suis]HEM3609124.1 hypothetical protein [Streptococcus suis]HEM3621185.1 hypothetical protein [Streptococcus suis]
MTNKEYVQTLLIANDIIYIDTSSLMNVTAFENFIENYFEIFMEHSKQIIVTREVCLEIVKHLSSQNVGKQDIAKRVIAIFKEYENIFIFEDENLNDVEANIAFADSELLSRMTRDRSNFRQLLITNDKNLSIDAYNLNSLNSCKGQRIMVCYINKNGKLNKGDTGNMERLSNEKNMSEVHMEVSTEEKKELAPKEREKGLKYFFYGFCLLLTGYGLGKISK